MGKATIILIGGPTASGKSAYACALARREGGVVINADAMQVYAGLPILTAQPSAQEKEDAPHVLYEVTDPSERSSAGRWRHMAEFEIQKAWDSGLVPILVGGTGLYFDALLGGLADMPEIPEATREMARGLCETLGPESFRSILSRLDPESAAKIKPNDKQRLIRAYEVVAHTGRTLGFWQNQARSEATQNPLFKDCTVRRMMLMPLRHKLYETCDARFSIMMERGALDEVRFLMDRDLDPDLPAMKILGVRELMDHLRGEMPLLDAIAAAQQHTRNYAKRQVTWFKNKWKDAEIVSA